MANEYGGNAPLSYNRYLRVADLIDLQNCLSDPAHHDELLFITIHQTYELWFKQILHEMDAAIVHMNENLATAATRAIKRIVEIEKVLVAQIHVLETMTPMSFLAFRSELNPGSGFQSTQFREIEFGSGLKSEELLTHFKEDDRAHSNLRKRYASPTLGDALYSLLKRRGFHAPLDEENDDADARRRNFEIRTRAILEVLIHFETHFEEFQLIESLIEHDEQFSLWRAHHVKMVERMVGSKRGTGGSEGVGYLRTTIGKKFFPELWDARTYLDVEHGMNGCPFAAGPEAS